MQGDEPLIEPEMIDAGRSRRCVADPTLEDVDRLRARSPIAADYTNPNVVKVVVDAHGDALYFSRAPIPHSVATIRVRPQPARVYKHIGLYGYRRDFLLTFAALPQTPLELAESLEQLRALEHGYRIRTVETEYDSIGVDTPEDLERVAASCWRSTRREAA